MSATYKVFIDGSSGTTGLRIADRLAARPEIQLLSISEEGRKDVQERAKVINSADLAFLCLPDAAAREVMPLLRPDVKILDTSTAHRTAPGWVYGFPELAGQREKIRQSCRVAVPGCHASGFIVLAAPLIQKGLVPADYPFTCHSLTGYSGGGKKMIGQYRDPDRPVDYDSPRAYGLGLHHKHLPEMKAICGLAAAPIFCPIVADYYSRHADHRPPADGAAENRSRRHCRRPGGVLSGRKGGQGASARGICPPMSSWPATCWRAPIGWRSISRPTRTAPRCCSSACLTIWARVPAAPPSSA